MPGSLSAAGQRREVSLEPASVFDECSAVLTPSDFAVLFVTAQTRSRPAGVRLLLRFRFSYVCAAFRGDKNS